MMKTNNVEEMGENHRFISFNNVNFGTNNEKYIAVNVIFFFKNIHIN